MIYLEALLLVGCIAYGAKLGGIGVGMAGALGMVICEPHSVGWLCMLSQGCAAFCQNAFVPCAVCAAHVADKRHV